MRQLFYFAIVCDSVVGPQCGPIQYVVQKCAWESMDVCIYHQWITFVQREDTCVWIQIQRIHVFMDPDTANCKLGYIDIDYMLFACPGLEMVDVSNAAD